MSRRDEIEDWREFQRNHPGKWWKYRHRRYTDNRLAAIAYCAAGFEIIPLSPASKFPSIPSPHPWDSPERGVCKGECGLLGHGFHDARADAEWAHEYWSAHPHDGIGVRPHFGGIVLDFDARHGGLEALAALEAEYGPLPQTATVISGRGDGGHHRWFDGVTGPVRSKLRPGVDILCHERNFVTVPPSLHFVTDEPYQFDEACVDIINDAPQWLIDECRKPDPPPRPPRPRWPATWRMSPSARLRRCQGLINIVTDACDGDRHNALLWSACRAAESGFLVEEDDPIWAELFDAADGGGLPHDEICHVLRGAIALAGED